MAVKMEVAVCNLLASYEYEEWKESPFASWTNRVFLRIESGHEAHVRPPASKGDCYHTTIYCGDKAIIGKGFGIEVHSLRTALKRLHPELIPGSDRIRFRQDGSWWWHNRPALQKCS